MNTLSRRQIHRTPLEISKQMLEIYRMPVPDGILTEAADRTTPHAHTYFEVLWFEEAGGTHMVDFQDYPIEKNSFFLIAPGQVHAFCEGPRPKGVVLDFTEDVFPAARAGDNMYVRYNLFGEASPRYVITEPEPLRALRHLVPCLESELKKADQLGHADMLGIMLKVILLIIYRQAGAQGHMASSRNNSALRLFTLFRREVEGFFRESRTVADYADRLGVTPKVLTTAVNECAHRPPHSFIEERVVLEAKRMLRCTDLKIKEIADQLGFDDVSYFVKFFKNNAGLLPKEFRLPS